MLFICRLQQREKEEIKPIRVYFLFNIRRAYLNMQVPAPGHSKRAFLALDAIKAFDLWAILDKFGLGSGFCKWVRLLYTAPGASVRMNDLQSPSFRLFRGTRQGCPLSLLLFALAIKPLACLIWASPDVTGLIRGDKDIIICG